MKVIKPNALPTTLASFSRASTATYIDDAGVLQTAAANVARWQGGQLLVEPAATNLLTYSTAFDNAVWSKSAATIGPNEAVAVDGTTTADRLIEVATTGQHYVLQSRPTAAGPATFSVLAKAAERSWIRLQVDNPAVSAFFDLSTGSIGVMAGSVVPRITALGNGWFLCSISFTAVIATPAFYIFLATGNNVSSYVGTGSSGAFVWGAQVEQNDAPTSRILTTTAAVTRAADIITGGGLLATSAIDAAPDYAAGITYASGTQVQYNRSLYESLQSANTGHQPDTSPAWWVQLGPANRWAMFDDQVNTQTVQGTGPLRVALQTGSMDALAVLGVDADSVRLVVQDGAGGPVVYDRVQGMAAESVASWFDYFFNDPTYRRTQALFSGIPLFGSSVATLTFSGSSVKVGHVSYGRARSLGCMRYGARAGIKDFSRKETDTDFGITTFVRRANSKYLTSTLEVDKVSINQVHNLLTSLTATPVVWIGSEDVYYSDTLLVFGFFRDFYCSIDYPMLALYSLEIEGLI